MDDYTNPDYIQRQFDAYLDGRLSEQEALELLHYLKEQPDTAFAEELMRRALDAPVTAKDTQTMLQLRQSRAELLARIQPSPRAIVPIWKKLAGVAAVLLIGLAIFFTLQTGILSNSVTIAVEHGSKRQITLPDGSTVWLDAGTELSYPKQFDGETRTVKLLSGQVFLDVKHDRSRPFIVQAGGLDVTVLGTSFEVRAFPNEAEVRVAVASGKVGVQPKDRSTAAVMLLPKEQIAFNRSKEQMGTKETEYTPVAQWRDDVLVFDKEPLPYVFRTLERRYKIEIDAPPSLDTSPLVTASFKDQSLDEVLEILAFSNSFGYEARNKKITIIKSPKPNNPK